MKVRQFQECAWGLLVVICVMWDCAGAPKAWSQSTSTFTNSVGMKLTLIPAGEFDMGGEEDALTVLRRFDYVAPDEIADEYPVHRVRITKPYYLGTHEVTLNQFLKFYHDAGYKTECERDGKGGWGWTGDGWEQRHNFVPWSWGFAGQTMEHPVVNVSWNDAQAFCEWLSRKEGRKYRLPTEAEWEYACRAGSNSRFSFGQDPEDLVVFANTADRSHRQIWPSGGELVVAKWVDGKLTNTQIPAPILRGNDGYGFTSPIGSFRPNAFGLYDMHGNVWEWCADWYGEKYYENSPTDDPQGPSTGTFRVDRGGGWSRSAAHCRSALRRGDVPAYRYYSLGFRVACVPSSE